MKLFTFKGGSHPKEGKELSADCAIRTLRLSGEYVFPLSQHIGAPAKPLVKKGDRVLVGQKIGEAGGMISSCVISSVSGTVKAVEPRMQTGGSELLSVVVENDELYETAPGVGTGRDYHTLSKEEIRAAVREAGIVGMGGAGFPTHVKLTPRDDEAITFFIANGAECEPYLTSDYRLMLEEAERILGGMEICLSLFPNAKGIMAIENNKPEAVRRMETLLKGHERIELAVLKTKYPEGGERQLIEALTGRYLRSDMLPADVGCIVDNVATLAAIDDAVTRGLPLTEKVITVTGDAVAEPANVRVRLGVSYQALADALGGIRPEAKKMICGGPMMGQALFTLKCPVTKPSSALCVFSEDAVSEQAETPCIRCARCLSACPEFLTPPLMIKAALKGDLAAYEALNGMECMECGSCSYVCPARRPLTQSFKKARKLVMAERRKAAQKAASEQKPAAERGSGTITAGKTE